MRKHYQTYQSIQSQELPSLNKMYDNLADMSSSLCHINPINRHKFRNEGNRQNSMSKSVVRVMKNQGKQISQRINTDIGEYIKVEGSRCKTYQTEIHSSVFEQIGQLILRVENNQKQIEKLKKQNESGSPSLKIQRDFKDIKDIYLLIRDQKTFQAQANKKINEQIVSVKKMLAYFKQQIQGANKNYESFDRKMLNVIKQVQNRVIQELDRKLQQQKQGMNHLRIEQKLNINLSEINNTKIQLLSKIKEIQLKISHNKFHSLKSHFVKSNKKCPNDQLIQIKVQQSMMQKQGIQHLQISQFVYYIDKNGYLLDHDHYYLLDENNQMIKIFDDQLKHFKEKSSLIY